MIHVRDAYLEGVYILISCLDSGESAFHCAASFAPFDCMTLRVAPVSETLARDE